MVCLSIYYLLKEKKIKTFGKVLSFSFWQYTFFVNFIPRNFMEIFVVATINESSPCPPAVIFSNRSLLVY